MWMSFGRQGFKIWYLVLVTLVSGVFLGSDLKAQVTLNVVGVDPTNPGVPQPVGQYRWLVEEDRTDHVTPGVPDPNTLSVSFHHSYMPVVSKGTATGSTSLTLPDPAKHYFVSVLPTTPGSFSIGGAPIAPGQTSVTVHVNKLPLPTAQITVFVFEDNQPINNAPDLPEEQGVGGFQILVEDAGGRYGISAGALSQDAFGNPLGTVYQPCPVVHLPGQCDPYENYLVDGDGNPIPDHVEPLVTGPCPGDTCGMLTIKNLSPGKYGVTAVPPAGQGWQQTSTIEGTKIIDAWVKAAEPPYFAEFGPPGYHVFIGFVRPFADATVLTGGATVSGKIVNLHLSRPPDYAFYNGAPFAHTTPWVGLNDNAGLAGASKGIYAARANGDGTFSIPNVPPGSYQLVVWDDALDLIFAFHGVTVNPGGPPYTCNTLSGCNLGDVPVFQWFTRLEHFVFSDDGCAGTPFYNPAKAGNGFRESCEMGIPEQAVNLRWRDGTVYQSFPTDGEGFVPFDQVFPFFSWQVAEVDFLRFKATGVTVVVDNGGPINPLNPWSFGGQLNPQPQFCTAADVANPYDTVCTKNQDIGKPRINPNTGDNLSRTETGPVLLEAFQGFIGQTSAFAWGKQPYSPGENGGISGVVYYDTTRAEDDPVWNFPEPWSPGIPRVTVNLYDKTGTILLNTTTTDSWDDNVPAGCQSEVFTFQGQPTDCYDGLRNFNQVRPGVFDGGYALTTYFVKNGQPVALGTSGAKEQPIAAGEYIVEVVTPTGYEIVKEEDKNVDFGDNYVPNPNLLPPACVGPGHLVPNELSLFPGSGIEPFFAGDTRPLCNRKKVFLNSGQNAAADFFLFTEVPVAGHIFGFILDDSSNEFDPTSPQFGEKYAPPWLPVSIRDWTGREIARTYSDQYGRYNALVPSTYTANRPSPSGMAPNMITTCMNASTLPNGNPDPLHNPQYSEFCYTFQYMPGATTYLDTPVVPVAAHAGPDRNPLDCEFPAGTPRIKQVSVNNGVGGGPYVSANGQTITITSMGQVAVPNPAYCPGPPITAPGTCPVIDNNRTILRDYGFGGGFASPNFKGSVKIGGVPLNIVSWSPNQVVATVPTTGPNAVGTGQLVVTRNDGKSTMTGVTVTVGPIPQTVHTVSAGGSIQAAIDAANAGDLILVGPGRYAELVIVWKPVRLQGWGEGSTTIHAVKAPAEKLQAWRAKVESLVNAGDVDVLPGQEIGFGGIEPVLLFTEEGAGILVLAKATGPNQFTNNPNARIDGFTITGADTGGGIVVNGYADFLEISNNRIVNNSGFFGGGVRVGHPQLTVDNLSYTDAENDNVKIHHNQISQNGGLGGVGGGVSLCTGSDNYEVTQNFVCGNFSLADGGGIGHLGVSNEGLIAYNTILFNENFNQGTSVSGGGVFIGGQPPLAGQPLTPGSGSVKVVGNLIQGNLAGAGDGGGIRTALVNGQDILSPPNQWFKVDMFNNMIVNNVAALAGGAISLQDTVVSNILHNTIANNDSTATASQAFSPGNSSQSNPQPAGIVARAHSAALAATLASPGGFSNPNLQDNIIWHNRSFYFMVDTTTDPISYKLIPDVGAGQPPVYNDLAVLGTATPQKLDPKYSILTNTAGYDATNLMLDPRFITEYLNGDQGSTIAFPEVTTSLQAPPAFDEGGNFIRVRFGPLTQTKLVSGSWVLRGDYHIQPISPAVDAGTDLTATFPDLAQDYDRQPRPGVPGGDVDVGADELQP